ncbi:MAG TPA: hypothetical protein VFZ12_06850 [Dehalococcoidia bacterium]|nr:hypothetical protein [Dehalococcoidia bacterium]
MSTVIYGDRETAVPAARDGDDLWITQADLTLATGWELKPEGVCRGEQCVPLPNAQATEFLRGDLFNLSRFAQHLGQPIVHDAGHDVWVFGEAAGPGASPLLMAPDFTLPDLNGREHTLSDFRGRKVFLATWASW